MLLAENFSSRVLRDVGRNNNPHKGMIGVSLNRFDIENGGKYTLVEETLLKYLQEILTLQF